MVKRQEVETKWVTAAQRLESYQKELTAWKASIVQQIEEQKAKDAEGMKQFQRGNNMSEDGTIKEALRQKEEELKMKETELKEKNEIIKAKDNQIRMLTEQLEKLRGSSGLSSTDKLLIPEKEEKEPEPQPAVPFTLKREEAPSLEGTVPFNAKRAGWLDTTTRADAILEVLCPSI